MKPFDHPALGIMAEFAAAKQRVAELDKENDIFREALRNNSSECDRLRAELAAAREALESYAYCGDNCGPAQAALAAITRPPDVTEDKP